MKYKKVLFINLLLKLTKEYYKQYSNYQIKNC